MRWAISSTFSIRQLAKLRPTIRQIVIVIIIVVIGSKQEFHNGGIIAQSYRSKADSCGFAGLQ